MTSRALVALGLLTGCPTYPKGVYFCDVGEHSLEVDDVSAFGHSAREALDWLGPQSVEVEWSGRNSQVPPTDVIDLVFGEPEGPVVEGAAAPSTDEAPADGCLTWDSLTFAAPVTLTTRDGQVSGEGLATVSIPHLDPELVFLQVSTAEATLSANRLAEAEQFLDEPAESGSMHVYRRPEFDIVTIAVNGRKIWHCDEQQDKSPTCATWQ